MLEARSWTQEKLDEEGRSALILKGNSVSSLRHLGKYMKENVGREIS